MRTVHGRVLVLLLPLLIAAAPSVRAQQPGPDPFGGNLFSPELVMQHQQEIALTDQQRSTITAEITKAQQRATEKEVKRAQVILLVRIKNVLTPEQRARLREIRDAAGK